MTQQEAAQQSKNEALNKIRFIYSKFYQYDENLFGDWNDRENYAEQRDSAVKNVLDDLYTKLKKNKDYRYIVKIIKIWHILTNIYLKLLSLLMKHLIVK